MIINRSNIVAALRRARGLIGLFLGAIFLAACAVHPKPSLYEQLGGREGVALIVDHLIERIGADDKIFHFYAETKISRFREHLQGQLCAVSDGPCHYAGDSMEQVHAGMMIQEADFNHLVELLIGAMEDAGTPVPAQNRLLARLAPMRGQILHR